MMMIGWNPSECSVVNLVSRAVRAPKRTPRRTPARGAVRKLRII